MVRRSGSYDMACRNVPCCTAQNDTSICAESTISSIFFIPICQPQCLDIVGKFTPTRYFFFSQLSYVLYKTWRKLGASSGGVRRTVAKTTKIGLFAGHLPKKQAAHIRHQIQGQSTPGKRQWCRRQRHTPRHARAGAGEKCNGKSLYRR